MSALLEVAPLSPTDIRLTLLRHGYKPVPAREKKPDFSKGWNKICAEANGKDIINWRYKYPRHTDTGILGGRHELKPPEGGLCGGLRFGDGDWGP